MHALFWPSGEPRSRTDAFRGACTFIGSMAGRGSRRGREACQTRNSGSHARCHYLIPICGEEWSPRNVETNGPIRSRWLGYVSQEHGNLTIAVTDVNDHAWPDPDSGRQEKIDCSGEAGVRGGWRRFKAHVNTYYCRQSKSHPKALYRAAVNNIPTLERHHQRRVAVEYRRSSLSSREPRNHKSSTP